MTSDKNEIIIFYFLISSLFLSVLFCARERVKYIYVCVCVLVSIQREKNDENGKGNDTPSELHTMRRFLSSTSRMYVT